MTKRTRNILFLILTILFFLIAPSLIFYSEGWRFDLRTKRIVKVGGFYFRVFPKRAEILINGREYKTDYFFGSLFIEGLLPREYQVKIEKEEFLPWEKRLKVREEETTKVEDVFLIPETVNFEILAKGIKDFVPSEDQEKMVLISEDEGWQLKLLDQKENLVAHLLKEKEIEEGAELEKIIFSPTKEVLIKARTKKERKYFLLDLETTSLTALDFLFSEQSEEIKVLEQSERFLDSDLEEISFSENGKKIFFRSENELFEADLIKKSSTSLLENVICYKVKKPFIYYLDNSGFLFKTDLKGERKEKLNRESFEIQEKDYEIYIFPSFTFLKTEDSLFLLDEEEGSFKEFSGFVKEIKISPDSKKLAFFGDHEIWIVFLTEIEKQPPKEKGEKLFLSRFAGKINEVYWYTQNYLIFNIGEEIKICEIDEVDKIQIWALKNIKGSKIFFNEESKRLYFLKEGNLFVTEKLIK